MAENGKVARLPHKIREEVNQRLLDGQTSREILPWLNEQPEVQQDCELHWEGVPISAQNLSAWRLGGFKKWLSRRARTESLKSLASHASSLASSGRGVVTGAQAIVAGQFLQIIEEVIDTDADENADLKLERLNSAALALKRLSSEERKDKGHQLDKEKLELEKIRTRLQESNHELAREKFEVSTAEKVLEWAKTPEALAILGNDDSRPEKIANLRQLMFGDQGYQES